MKYRITLLMLTASSAIFGQGKDPARTTTAPLTGGVNVNYMIAPMSSSITVNQLTVDVSSRLYKIAGTKHPLFVKGGVRYQSLYLAGDKSIGADNFHSITVPVSVTYIASANTNITGFVSAGIASDFLLSPTQSDMIYNAGIRFGFRQTKNFKLGVTLIYSDTYSGRTLLPLPDFEWKISDRWKLEALMPVRTSLKYKLDKKQTLALTQGFNTSMYRVNDSTKVGKYLQFQQITTGLMYERTFGRHWVFNLITGYAFNQKLQTFTNDQKTSFNDLGALKDRVKQTTYEKNSIMLQGALIFKF